MEPVAPKTTISENITRHFVDSDNPKKMLLIVVISSIVLGAVSGFLLATKDATGDNLSTAGTPNTPQADTRTFRDFAEGTIKAKPQPKDPTAYTEGTHNLEREGAVPVALTSSVVDLSLYEGKNVKVFGETQKALKEGWLMDVGKVEEIN
ncbi:hypothetical protein HYZ05_03270 [Candidatus Daviesbacteria bacterium]|nr:hypothetical protein [Candidatus Daviesbacteria bacterium]